MNYHPYLCLTWMTCAWITAALLAAPITFAETNRPHPSPPKWRILTGMLFWSFIWPISITIYLVAYISFKRSLADAYPKVTHHRTDGQQSA